MDISDDDKEVILILGMSLVTDTITGGGVHLGLGPSVLCLRH